MKRTGTGTQAVVIGTFLFLAAAACAVAPLSPLLRSAGILFLSYLSFSFAGMPAAFLTALVAPAVGLLSGGGEWLVMLPLVLASNLLAMLGLDYAWKYAALLVSPALQAAPQLVAMVLSRQELFFVDLPWGTEPMNWIMLHALVAVMGVLSALLADRRRRAQAARAAAQG